MAAAGTDQTVARDVEGAASPKDTNSANRTAAGEAGRSGQAMENAGKALEPRADPDAQTTVTDFLDFTEYLPSDVIRSLTLIGKLDETYADASIKVDELTTTWGQLPSLAVEDRPSPVKLRADISEKLSQALSSRVFAHDEAVRMSENVNRHYNKAKVLLAKLQDMMDHYPTEEPKSPVVPRSPHAIRAKPTGGEDGQKIRRHRIPKVTVPGEVFAPYEIEYDTASDDSDISTDEDSDMYGTGRRTPATPRIKIISNKIHKPNSRLARPVSYSSAAMTAAAAANAAALLNPPPENAVIGSADAPWLQLTNYELAKLRKRMKKNATWTPSETMVARELKALGRGPDEYREAKKKAEDEGKEFNPKVPTLVVDDESGAQHLPAGAISADSIWTEEVPTSNRGMKLNEAKKLKREALAKLAAEEAEESARKMTHAAKVFMGNEKSKSEHSKDPKEPKGGSQSQEKPRTISSRPLGKRKREGDSGTEAPESAETTPPRPQPKRSKMETPVPPPHHPGMNQNNAPPADFSSNQIHINNTASSNKNNSNNNSSLQSMTPGTLPQPETPVPIPVPPRSSSQSAMSRTPNSTSSNNVTTTSIPVKPPAETPVPLPRTDRRKSMTPVAPPSREPARRETRGEAAKRTQHVSPPDVPPLHPASRGQTPVATRPGSRGKAASQEPPSLAADRPRRSSTARNTPMPEFKQPAKRTKRPAPGVVSTTNSGGSSAVGKRKAPPKKKARATKREKGQALETEMEEVDEEGNPIDPAEPRYCMCNRVSFGTMIECDNFDVSRPDCKRSIP
ncbi:PHD finger domain-containing protein [Metarhizium album ARSEF 1941]|uniref:PHD finger domain-containing protein n=1 Tax=Metarhizium album (strain ARSEF 1941) TaxID=1081103 RepID=A0A0B2X126_METAS|nr:PHD finger domain-containing protein [Metarhizium album ARSEF 1941]KHN99584.1 PHD finger domain-containing protein [Metarhizium album ARSEF 1941]